MSKNSYVEYLAHQALYAEYTKPGVGCHPALKHLLYTRGWADPTTGQLTGAGRRHMTHLINRHIITGDPIPGAPMKQPTTAEFPTVRPPEPRDYDNEDLRTIAIYTVLFALSVAAVALTVIYVTHYL